MSLASIYTSSLGEVSAAWGQKCLDEGWNTGDVTFPSFTNDAPIDPNAGPECQRRYIIFAISTILQWILCFDEEDTVQGTQDCVDAKFDDFKVKVAGCLASA